MASSDLVMGVDIGGTGVKAALVDIKKGVLTTERVRLDTPQPAIPDAIIGCIQELQKTLKWKGAVGCGFPGLVMGGKVRRAPNLDPSWIGHDLATDLKEKMGVSVVAIGNDADAAGLAEVTFGAGKGIEGTAVMVTLGTGIGTAVFHNGDLLPDTELGHLELGGKDAELTASNSVRERKGLKWKKWAKGVDKYLTHLEYLLGVDLFMLGGGVSKKPDKFVPYLKKVSVPIVAATMGNMAGIVGAAMFAVPGMRAEARKSKKKASKKKSS